MFGDDPFRDTVRLLKASATNAVARLAPAFYLRLTGQTGRGSAPESTEEVADYFRRCVDDYLRELGVEPSEVGSFLSGKRVLEYGPGDVCGVALLLYALGAERVVCVDRFPMAAPTPKGAEVLRAVTERLPGPARERAASAFNVPGDAASGLRRECVEYRVRPSGLSDAREEFDLVLSRAVLEHVDDLPATFADMARALRPGGRAVHLVDLKSHGLHTDNPLDFLTWPVWLWSLMYSAKGVPNRWRVDRYRDATARAGLAVLRLTATVRADPADVRAVRPHLAAPFRAVSDDDLGWLEFWLLLERGA